MTTRPSYNYVEPTAPVAPAAPIRPVVVHPAQSGGMIAAGSVLLVAATVVLGLTVAVPALWPLTVAIAALCGVVGFVLVMAHAIAWVLMRHALWARSQRVPGDHVLVETTTAREASS